MSDRELMELAAKAAGVDIRRLPHAWPNRFDDEQWDPLNDDGDALRLAVKLNLIPTQDRMLHLAWVNDNKGEILAQSGYGECDFCEYAATRRAIVLAAAEIGKGIQS